MRLDKDLVRTILLAIEASALPDNGPIDLVLPERTQEELSYHVMLLAEGGFLKALDLSDKDELLWLPERLTYSGHEFLDTIRDGEVWRRTRSGAEQAGVASIGFVWELAKAYGKQVITERLGIPLA